MILTNDLLLVPKLRMNGAIPQLLLYAFKAWTNIALFVLMLFTCVTIPHPKVSDVVIRCEYDIQWCQSQ
jgi:hypothetical protein